MLRRRSPAGIRNGFITGWIMLGLILMAVFVGAVALVQNDTSSYSTITRVSSELNGQASLIRSQVSACVLQYPSPSNSGGRPYPISYSRAGTSTAIAMGTEITIAAADPVSNLRFDLECPNAPASRRALFGGFDGVFMPATPAGFLPWTYTMASATGEIYIEATLQTSKRTVLSYQEGLRQALTRYTSAEAQLLPSSSAPITLRVYIRR